MQFDNKKIAGGVLYTVITKISSRKFWRMAKLTTLLFFVGCLHVCASVYSQKITLHAENAPLASVLKSIEQQSGHYFIYYDKLLNLGKPVTVKLENVPLLEALEFCFKDQPLVCSVVGNDIVIRKKDEAVLHMPDSFYVSRGIEPVRGRVTDSVGNPLEGATVMIKRTGLSVHTNAKGVFELEDAYPGDSLVVSYIGYMPRDVIVPASNNFLYIYLKASDNELDQTVIQAYGTTTQRFTVGSISTVTSTEIEQQPVTNPLLTLEGRVPGLVVTPASGAPGATVQIQIRGQNTLRQISTGNSVYDQPLFIVDGVPFATQNKSINIYQTLAGSLSPFNDLNPADIESISVLKDADATSIYGSQGSNGVVIITTKKGKAGKTVFNIRVNTGPNKITKVTDMLNTSQYLQIRRDAFANDAVTPTAVNAPDLLVFDTTKYTNWFKQFMGGTANSTDAHLNLSGGSQSTTFILSGGYTRTVYNFPGNFADNRWTMHSGLHHNSLNRHFNADFGTDIAYDENNSAGSPGTGLTLAPDFPDLLDPNGNLVWNYKGVDLTNYQTYTYLKQPSNIQSFNLNSTLRLSYQLAAGLDISTNLGYSRLTTQEYAAIPNKSLPPNGWQTSSASFGANIFQTINIEPQINYSKKIGLGQLSVLAGGAYKKSLTYTSDMRGNNYSDDDLLNSISGAATTTVSNSNTIYKYAGLFGRIGYIYDQKYIFNLTGRRDGSSNFGPGRQFGNFGSIGAGWIFSEENGFKKVLPFVSYAKLSGNYGTSGGDGIAPYQYQPFWQPYYGNPFQGSKPYEPVNLFNPDYSWDTKKSLNIALNLGFLKDRLMVSAGWYRNRTGDQLVTYPLPSQAGFMTAVENLNATVQDMGWEFSVSSKNIVKKDFSWTTSFNLSFNRNKLLSFPGLASSSYASFYTIGNPVSQIMGYKYKGVNDTTGLFQFYKANGTLTNAPTYSPVANGGDLQPITDLAPKFTGGFGNTITYMRFSVTVFFQFAKSTTYNQLYAYYGGNYIPGGFMNIPESILGKYWQEPGDHAELEKLSAVYGPAENAAFAFMKSSGAFSDDSYIRLKTLSVSYNLPGKWIKKMHMQQCSIYVNAQNLLTITNYKGLDPELPGQIYIIPLQRTMVAGLSFDF